MLFMRHYWLETYAGWPDRCKMDKNGTEMQRRSRCSCDATNLEGFLDGEPRHEVTAKVFDVSAVSLVNLGCKSPTLSWWPPREKNDMDRFQKKKTCFFSMTFVFVDADRRQRLRVGPFLRCRAPPPWLNNFCQPKKCAGRTQGYSVWEGVKFVKPHSWEEEIVLKSFWMKKLRNSWQF